jgi:hypothetical protein
VHLLRGDATDLQGECRRYDAAIAKYGGIDLCVLGLGANGHIAFNEPGCSWEIRTHVVQLASATRAVQKRPTEPDWPVPESGITLGIRNLLEARNILLLDIRFQQTCGARFVSSRCRRSGLARHESAATPPRHDDRAMRAFRLIDCLPQRAP